jgi:splicing factor 3B subunit 4
MLAGGAGGRISAGVGANLLGIHSTDKNQDATVYVGGIDPQATEELIWELFVQAGPVGALGCRAAHMSPFPTPTITRPLISSPPLLHIAVSVHLPKDRVTSSHQGYGFIEFKSEDDADYALKILNMVKVHGKPLRVNKAAQDKAQQEVGANLFIGNLDPDVDETVGCGLLGLCAIHVTLCGGGHPI